MDTVKSKTEQVYRWVTENHLPGFQFTSHDVHAALNIDKGPISGALYKIERGSVIKAVGKAHMPGRGRCCFVYEYVSHEPMRFNRSSNGSMVGRQDTSHKQRTLEYLDGSNGTRYNGNGAYEPEEKKLSARLLRLAVLLEQQRQLRKAAMNSGASVIPPRATKAMLDQLIDIAWEIEMLEHKNAELQTALDKSLPT